MASEALLALSLPLAVGAQPQPSDGKHTGAGGQSQFTALDVVVMVDRSDRGRGGGFVVGSKSPGTQIDGLRALDGDRGLRSVWSAGTLVL